MSSLFDPESFLDAVIEQPTEKRDPLPAGEYTARISKLSARTWQGKKDPTKSGVVYDVLLAIDVPYELRESHKFDSELFVRDGIMLDLTEGGTIDNSPGKNGKLRAYREATKMNNPGEPFSARKLLDQIVLVRISHDLWEGSIVEKVAGVSGIPSN